jgi:hypothetical protein
MKCLSIQQPWSWAILYAGKTIENRTWPTDYRGPLLIHAGRSRECLGAFGPGEPPADRLVFGAVLGVVDLLDCVPLHLAPHTPFTEGPWCWVVANPRPLAKPFPCRGMPGLFDVDMAGVDSL